MAESEKQSVCRSAMDFLARREHSFSELTCKLKSWFIADVVESTLLRLVNEGLQSDERLLKPLFIPVRVTVMVRCVRCEYDKS